MIIPQLITIYANDLIQNVVPNHIGVDVNDTGSFVFIVDDDNSVRRSLGRLLKAAGLSVKTFDSAQNFLDSYQDDEAACLVLDVRMPKMSGLDLQKRLIESGSKVPIIFITAHEDLESREQAMNAGAIAFLRKPFEEQLLLEAICKVFNPDFPDGC